MNKRPSVLLILSMCVIAMGGAACRIHEWREAEERVANRIAGEEVERQRIESVRQTCQSLAERRALYDKYRSEEKIRRLYRFHGDGTLDSSFRPTDLIFDEDIAASAINWHIDFLSNGFLLFGFRVAGWDPFERPALVKILRDGEVDRSFHDKLNEWLHELYQPNIWATASDRILVSARSAERHLCTGDPLKSQAESYPTLIRINADGSHDKSFSAEGFPSDINTSGPFPMILAPNSDILLAPHSRIPGLRWTAEGRKIGELTHSDEKYWWEDRASQPNVLFRFMELNARNPQKVPFVSLEKVAQGLEKLIPSGTGAPAGHSKTFEQLEQDGCLTFERHSATYLPGKRRILLTWIRGQSREWEDDEEKTPDDKKAKECRARYGSIPREGGFLTTVIDSAEKQDFALQDRIATRFKNCRATEVRFSPHLGDQLIVLRNAGKSGCDGIPNGADGVILNADGTMKSKVQFPDLPGMKHQEPPQIAAVDRDGNLLRILETGH